MSKSVVLVVLAVIAFGSFFILPWMLFFETDGAAALSMVGDESMGSLSITLVLIPLASLVIVGLFVWSMVKGKTNWLYSLIASGVTLIPCVWFFLWMQANILSMGVNPLAYGYYINVAASVTMTILSAAAYWQSRQQKVAVAGA